jgi:hypothetical protein
MVMRWPQAVVQVPEPSAAVWSRMKSWKRFSRHMSVSSPNIRNRIRARVTEISWSRFFSSALSW